jgi:hypothetical protein
MKESPFLQSSGPEVIVVEDNHGENINEIKTSPAIKDFLILDFMISPIPILSNG